MITTKVQENLSAINTIFNESFDVVIREFMIGAEIEGAIVFIVGLVDEASLNENLIKPLLFTKRELNTSKAFSMVEESLLSVGIIKEAGTLDEVVNSILSGDTALLIEGANRALIVSLRGWKSRNVDEPATEAVVRGPREGFIETIGTNVALLRRKVKNPNLKFEQMKIGKVTQTVVCIGYIRGIANEKIVQEVRDRLSRIDVDAILESGYIEAYIEDAPFSLFPTIRNSEKPDIVSANLLEGRIAILIDGTPFVLTVPYLFVEAFQNSEDYYARPFYASFIRLLRWLAFFVSTFGPGLYVAITTYHQELLPPALLISIAAAQEGTPFPLIVEALLMQIVYEILREAGVRLPRPVGQAVSIVGALVIGDAAVSAGLVGAPMVVVVALTAISSFVVPTLIDVNALSRFALLILGGLAGIYGIMLGFIAFLIYQCSLRSFGVPYFSPLAPTTPSELRDVFIRGPWWAMNKRPRLIGKDSFRQQASSKPKPPEKE